MKIDEKVTAKPRTDHQTDVSMLLLQSVWLLLACRLWPAIPDPAGRNESNICEACTIDGIFGQAATGFIHSFAWVSPSFGRRNYAALRVPFTFLRFV
jgi:hypothetical protein